MAGACATWGLGPIWIRGLLTYLPPAAICCLRVLIALPILLVAFVGYDRDRLRAMVRRPATWLGGLGLSANMLCYAAATQFISPSEVNLLFQINVVSNAVFGVWIFGESIPTKRYRAFAAVLSGAALVILGRAGAGAAGPVTWQARLLGSTLALGAGIAGSATQVAIRDVSRRGLGLPATVPMHLVAALVFASSLHFRLGWHRVPDAGFWWPMLLLGLISSGLAAVLACYALPRISLAQAGVTATTQPVVTIAVSSLFLGEHPTPLTLAGAALVVGGVVYSARLERHVHATTPLE